MVQKSEADKAKIAKRKAKLNAKLDMAEKEQDSKVRQRKRGDDDDDDDNDGDDSDYDYGGGDDDDDDDDEGSSRKGKRKPKGYFGQIKWKYVAFIFLLFGTAIIPVVLQAVDMIGGAASNSGVINKMSHKLGLAPTPKDRLTKFYKKHAPDKGAEAVDSAIAKYSGDYEKMVKILEAKYGDYGFFLEWEKDSDMRAIMKKETDKAYKVGQRYFRKYAPQPVQRICYNISMNFSFVYKKVMGIVGPIIWPGEPVKKRPSSRSSSSKKRR